MSETAARPWWADVEHLRPTEDSQPLAVAPTARPRTGRFARETVKGYADGSVATLERPDPSHFPAPLAPSNDEAATTPARRRRAAAAVADEARARRERAAADEPRPRARRERPTADEPRPRAHRERPAADEPRPRAHRERPDVDLRPRGAAFAEYRDGRRTVAIKGQVDRATAPVPAPYTPREPGDRRRPRKSAVERLGSSPDRIAMYAVLLGLLLILVAALSTPGAGA